MFNKVATNGIYNIVDQHNNSFPVYCDFGSEPGYAWTLIQSYSLQNSSAFKNKAFYLHDMPISQDAPEWSSYRLSMSRMKSIRDVSTHWRATCNFLADGIDFCDYIRTSFANTDFLAVPDSPDSNRCILYEFVDIRGNRCENCSVYSPYSAQFDYISTAGGMSVVTSLHDKEESKTKIILVIMVYATLLSGAAPRPPPQLSTGLAPLNEHNLG